MEALIFSHYLTTQSLLSHSPASELLPPGILLTPEDWLLGVFDAVGEMMRWAITGIALGLRVAQGADGERSSVADLRELRSELEVLSTKGSGVDWDARKKMEVMKACVDKVEMAVYGMIVRGRERPKGWVPDLEEKGEGMGSY